MIARRERNGLVSTVCLVTYSGNVLIVAVSPMDFSGNVFKFNFWKARSLVPLTHGYVMFIGTLTAIVCWIMLVWSKFVPSNLYFSADLLFVVNL